MDPRYNEIGPGFWGFIATFVLAVALIFLGLSLTRHLRKVRLEAQAAQLAAQQAQAPAGEGSQASD